MKPVTDSLIADWSFLLSTTLNEHFLNLGRAIGDTTSRLREGALVSVIGALRGGQLTLGSSAVGIAGVAGISGKEAELVSGLFRAATHSMDEVALSQSLEGALDARKAAEGRSPQVDLVWSGPEVSDSGFRSHADVLREMIQDSQVDSEVLIVGYSLNVNDQSPIADFLDLTSTRSRRLGQVRFVLHEDHTASNLEQLERAWSTGVVKPELFTWRPDGNAPYIKMHAKVLVVGRSDLLVTSANLTHHGMSENLELGVRVRGPQAEKVAVRFDRLISDGKLVAWPRD